VNKNIKILINPFLLATLACLLSYLFVCSVGFAECEKISKKQNLNFVFTWQVSNFCYFKREGVQTTFNQEYSILKEK
jgi:hypothetical protein